MYLFPAFNQLKNMNGTQRKLILELAEIIDRRRIEAEKRGGTLSKIRLEIVVLS